MTADLFGDATPPDRRRLDDSKIYIGIIGSRRRNAPADYELVRAAYLDRNVTSKKAIIVSGGCPSGGDHFAEIIARIYEVETIIHYPDKLAYPELRQPIRAAKQNYERNTLIARDSRDFLIACVASDRHGGTEDTIKKWKRMYPGKQPILV